MTGNLNPQTGLRIHGLHLSVGWDLSLRAHSSADHIGLDGQPFDQSGYTARIPPHEWHTMTVLDLMQRAHDSHHDAFGLNRPDTPPLALHPQGGPATAQVAEGEPPDYDAHLVRLIAHVTAVKQDELNAGRADGVPPIALDPTAHPLAPQPAPPAASDPPPAIDVAPPAPPPPVRPSLG